MCILPKKILNGIYWVCCAMQRDCPHLVEDAAAAASLGMLHLTNWGRSNHKELYFDGDNTRFVTKDVACHFRIKRAYNFVLIHYCFGIIQIQTITVLNQNKKILELWDKSRQLSQAEKRNDSYVTFWLFLNFTKWQLHIFNQNGSGCKILSFWVKIAIILWIL